MLSGRNLGTFINIFKKKRNLKKLPPPIVYPYSGLSLHPHAPCVCSSIFSTTSALVLLWASLIIHASLGDSEVMLEDA